MSLNLKIVLKLTTVQMFLLPKTKNKSLKNVHKCQNRYCYFETIIKINVQKSLFDYVTLVFLTEQKS